MNLKSQQLRSDLSLEIDFDQTLTQTQIKQKLIEILGKGNCFEETIANRKVFVYLNDSNIIIIQIKNQEGENYRRIFVCLKFEKHVYEY